MTPRSSMLLREACEAGETAATQFILSRLEKKLIRSLDVQVSSEEKEGTTFYVEVSLDVDPALDIDLDGLSDAAADAALSAIEEKMHGRARKKAKPLERKENRG